MDNKVMRVAHREYTELVQSKVFWISVLLPMAVMAVALLMSGNFAKKANQAQSPSAAVEKTAAQESQQKASEQAAAVRERRERTMVAAFFSVFLMFMALNMSGQMLLTSLIEEKSSRVMEVLLSAVSPLELMTGKILGLTAVGLTLTVVWATTAAGAAAMAAGFTGNMDGVRVGIFVVYYLLGIVMFSSLYAAIGAACNSLKEAQTLIMPLVVIFIVPMMAWTQIAQHPNETLAVALSIIPLTSPMVMVLRVAMLPELPVLQIAISVLALGVTVPVVFWAAAKVFRTGVLMYGKPPKLAEMWHWVRQP